MKCPECNRQYFYSGDILQENMRETELSKKLSTQHKVPFCNYCQKEEKLHD